jgi:hypothetical protein
MGWSPLGTQFCLQIAFGVLFALAFVPRAPVGTLFYRIMGTAALVPLLVALVAPVATGARPWNAPEVLASALAVAAYPVVSGPVRGRRWAAGLAVALFGNALALGLLLWHLEPDLGPAELAMASLSALATGAVAGSVGVAMVLGHWYLTVPNLSVVHLRRLNRVTVASMVASLLLVGATCLLFRERLTAGRSLFGPTGLFYLGTRVGVGILLPLLFAAMAAGSLRYRNTRSATGILYASTVLVLIGAAVSIVLQDTYGLPL